MLARVKVMFLGFVGDDAGAFNDGQYLVGRMNVRFRPRSVVEEDGNDLELFALVASNQVLHVNRPLEVFGIGGSGLGLIGLREVHF